MATEKVYHRKLVRDKVPPKLTKKGVAFSTRPLSDIEFQEKLRRKLIEEATEVGDAKTRDELVNEIADVLEVIDELRRSNELHASQIAAAKRKKFSENGGYKERIFLEWAEKDSQEPEVRLGWKVGTNTPPKRA